ncbi:hypothetical protein ACTXT7_008260 [Hymenolepis weldensis]
MEKSLKKRGHISHHHDYKLNRIQEGLAVNDNYNSRIRCLWGWKKTMTKRQQSKFEVTEILATVFLSSSFTLPSPQIQRHVDSKTSGAYARFSRSPSFPTLFFFSLFLPFLPHTVCLSLSPSVNY